MRAPTLFTRLLLAQLAGATALLVIAGSAFYVERNRTVARLMADRWAPALIAAAGLPPAPAPLAHADARSVRVARERPADALPPRTWAPRIAMLRDTLREDGLPAGEIVFTPGAARPLTWVEVRLADGQARWLGFDDDVIEAHILGRTALTLVLGLAAVALAAGLLARRIAGPLEALRRRIEAHDGDPGALAPAAAPGAATQEIAAIEHAWLALRGRLAQHERERALLLAGVSHDLRSPLARIRMAAELLPDDPGIAARREGIVRNVEIADRLIAGFLDYVRAGELPLDETVDLVAVARRQVQARALPPDQLALAVPGRLALPRANELLLERVIANLIDNALRHGRPPVTLAVRDEPGACIVEVADHGPGIAPERREALTQAFARGDASRVTPGTGLGLAVVQQVARRMGGALEFELAPDGTHFVRARLPK